MERVVVVGPGAMGTLLAGKCAEAGIPVRLLDYRPERAERLSREGISVIDADGTSRTHHIPCTTGGNDDAPPTHVFLCVKSEDTANALSRALDPRAVVVSLQNGLRHVQVIREHVPRERSVFGTTAHGVTRLETGKVRHCGQGETLIAAEEENAVPAKEVAAFLNRIAIQASVVEDLDFILWRKLLFNAAINPVTALLGIRNGRVPRISGAWEVASSCFREAREVAGSSVGPEIGQVSEEDLRDVCEQTEENISSMLQDLRRGKRTEIHALNGVVVEEAVRYGKTAPVNGVMVKLITALEEARR